MSLLLQLRMMIKALLQSRLRSFSAAGAIGLGIASMTIMLALTSGAEREMQAIADQMGKNLFTVKAGEVLSQPGRGTGWYTSTRLRDGDVNTLRRELKGVTTVAPVLETSLQVKFRGDDMVSTVRGVSADFIGLRNFTVQYGRALDAQDEDSQNRVAVVGRFVADKLGKSDSLVGATVTVAGIPFEVVGQLAPKGISSDGSNEDDQVLVPITTARRRLYNVEYFSRLLVQMRDADALRAALERTRELLRENHRLKPAQRDDFEVLSLVKSNEVRRMSSGFVGALAQVFAATTLLIGCAGVFSVTYLNVKDRTAEIGLRKALGATRRDIAMLFVAEACLLSAAGGLVGLGVGLGAGEPLRWMTGWQVAIDPRGVALPLLASVLIGFFFSVVPAVRASRLAPAFALRSA